MKARKILMIAVIITICLGIQGVFIYADDVSTNTESEVEIDPTSDIEIPTNLAIEYKGFPIVNYYLTDEDYVVMEVNGILFDDVTDFFFDNINISSFIEEAVKNGSVVLTTRNDGFNLQIKFTPEQLGDVHEFGIAYLGDNMLASKYVKADLLNMYAGDKDFGEMRIFGNVKYREAGCTFLNCWKDAANVNVSIEVRSAEYGVTNYSTTTKADGTYEMYINDNCGDVSVVAMLGVNDRAKTETKKVEEYCDWQRKNVQVDINIK